MKSKQWAKLLIGSFCLSILSGVFISQIAKAKPSLTKVETILPEDVPWENNLDLAGVETAKVIGNPGNAELYVLLNKMQKGAVLPAHTHPDNRVTTVLSGQIYYGTGNKFERANVKPYPAGSIIYTPANTPHYLWAKNRETVMQQTGIGPTEIDFLE